MCFAIMPRDRCAGVSDLTLLPRAHAQPAQPSQRQQRRVALAAGAVRGRHDWGIVAVTPGSQTQARLLNIQQAPGPARLPSSHGKSAAVWSACQVVSRHEGPCKPERGSFQGGRQTGLVGVRMRCQSQQRQHSKRCRSRRRPCAGMRFERARDTLSSVCACATHGYPGSQTVSREHAQLLACLAGRVQFIGAVVRHAAGRRRLAVSWHSAASVGERGRGA